MDADGFPLLSHSIEHSMLDQLWIPQDGASHYGAQLCFCSRVTKTDGDKVTRGTSLSDLILISDWLYQGTFSTILWRIIFGFLRLVHCRMVPNFASLVEVDRWVGVGDNASPKFFYKSLSLMWPKRYIILLNLYSLAVLTAKIRLSLIKHSQRREDQGHPQQGPTEGTHMIE